MLAVLVMFILTLLMLVWIIRGWALREKKGSMVLARLMGVVSHFAGPGFLALVAMEKYEGTWMKNFIAGDLKQLLWTLWALTIFLVGYHMAFENAIGFLNTKNYSFSVLIDDVTEVTTYLMSFIAVAGYFMAAYEDDCRWLSEGLKSENKVFLIFAATVFWDLIILGLYRLFVLPIGMEANTRAKCAEWEKNLLKKRKPLFFCPCCRRVCHLETKDEVSEETGKGSEES